jgi:hypothetical protein
VELGGPEDRPRQPRRLDQALGLELGLVVAVGDLVDPNDGDVDQVWGSGGPGGLEQVAGAVDVDPRPEEVAGAVDDRPDAGDGVRQALAAEQLTGHPSHPSGCAGRAGVAAEHPDLVAGVQQPGDHAAARGAVPAGDQNRLPHDAEPLGEEAGQDGRRPRRRLVPAVATGSG